MLLNNLVFKLSVLLTTLSVAQGSIDPLETAQSPIGMDSKPDSDLRAQNGLMLSDILTIQTSASIFYSYARESRVGELLKQDKARITVFAPTNKAVMALARKPHQGPEPVDDDAVISEEEFESRSRENVERWISAHIVAQISSLSPSSEYETLLEGVKVIVNAKSDQADSAKPDWQQVVLNDNISVIDKAEASNGVLYLLDGALYG